MHGLSTMKRLNDEHCERHFENKKKNQLALLQTLTDRKAHDEKLIEELKVKLGI